MFNKILFEYKIVFISTFFRWKIMISLKSTLKEYFDNKNNSK